MSIICRQFKSIHSTYRLVGANKIAFLKNIPMQENFARKIEDKFDRMTGVFIQGGKES